MTVRNPPSYLQTEAHPAEHDRLLISALLAAQGGVVRWPFDLTVEEHAGTPDMSVDVDSGDALIPGTESLSQGMYHVHNDATITLAIAAAHATNPRKDLIVAVVEDEEYGGSVSEARIEVVTGTATPGLVQGDAVGEPATPDNAIKLARVFVPATDTAITNSQITDLRTSATAAGGVFRCTSATRPVSPWTGLEILETDTTRRLVWDGTAWVRTAWYGAAGRTGATVTRTSNLNIPNNVQTDVTWNNEVTDSDGFITPTSANFTVPAGLGGLYMMQARIVWSADPTASSALIFIAGGIDYRTLGGLAFTRQAVGHTVGPVPLSPGDVVTLAAFQNSGGAINVQNGSRLNLYRIAA